MRSAVGMSCLDTELASESDSCDTLHCLLVCCLLFMSCIDHVVTTVASKKARKPRSYVISKLRVTE